MNYPRVCIPSKYPLLTQCLNIPKSFLKQYDRLLGYFDSPNLVSGGRTQDSEHWLREKISRESYLRLPFLEVFLKKVSCAKYPSQNLQRLKKHSQLNFTLKHSRDCTFFRKVFLPKILPIQSQETVFVTRCSETETTLRKPKVPALNSVKGSLQPGKPSRKQHRVY